MGPIYILPKKFKKLGQVFTQVKAGKYAYIYARSDEFGIICYEVFKRLVKQIPIGSFEWKSKKYGSYEAYERYPGNENFGVWAKCCHNLDRAMFHFDNYQREGRNGKR